MVDEVGLLPFGFGLGLRWHRVDWWRDLVKSWIRDFFDK